MRKTPTKGRYVLSALAIVVVAAIGLSGGIDASGLEVEGVGSAGEVTSDLQTAPDGPTTDTPEGDAPTGESSENDDAATEAAATGSAETTTTGPPATAAATTTAGSSSDSDGGAEASGSSSETQTESADDPPSDTAEPEGPRRGEVVTDGPVRVQSHDIKDYPNGEANVGGTLVNPSDGPVEQVRVTVSVYDESGTVLDEQTSTVGDLGPGESATYAAAFDGVDYSDVDRYRIEASAVESPAETPASGSSTTPAGDEQASEPADESEGPQRGDVTSDESTRILSHDIKDYPDGKANVGGTLENPTDRTLDLVRVTVVLYDDSDARLGEKSTEMTDLEPGAAVTYVATFEEVGYQDVARYEVTSVAVETNSTTPTETSGDAGSDDGDDLPEPEGPQRGQVDSDNSTHVLSHDIKDYPDGTASVGGTLMNPTDENASHVHVNVRLYDEADEEIGNETVCILDVPAGGSSAYSVPFQAVNYTDVDRYEVETFVSDD